MYKGNSSRMFPIVLVLVIIVIVILTLVTIGRALFGGGTAGQSSDPSKNALLNISPSSSVRMIIRGPIIADENFQTSEVLVTPSSRKATLFSGYLNQTIENDTLENNTRAYEELVYALSRANLMSGTQFVGDKNDIRGVCSNGNLYEFEVRTNQTPVKHLWTTSCKGYKGSLKATLSQVRLLFLTQIPRNSPIIDKIDL